MECSIISTQKRSVVIKVEETFTPGTGDIAYQSDFVKNILNPIVAMSNTPKTNSNKFAGINTITDPDGVTFDNLAFQLVSSEAKSINGIVLYSYVINISTTGMPMINSKFNARVVDRIASKEGYLSVEYSTIETNDEYCAPLVITGFKVKRY